MTIHERNNILNIENRLKTLEEKIEFIMENSRVVQKGENYVKAVSLKDLWDEENEPNFEEIRIKNKEIADEMLNNEPSVNTELLEEEAKHGYGHACSIYSGINCSYCGRKAIKSFVEEDHNMKISTASNENDWGKILTTQNGDFKTSVKECEHFFNIDNLTGDFICYKCNYIYKVYEQCAETLDKEDKKKEILEEFENNFDDYYIVKNILKSWLSDKLDEL